MIRTMMLAAVLSMVGCGTLRDSTVYATEIQFVDLTVRRGAPAVRRVLSTSCVCAPETVAWTSTVEGFASEDCEALADWYRTYVGRWEWHLSMMRYNGGMEGVADPGAVPEVVRSCDLPESPTTVGGGA